MVSHTSLAAHTIFLNAHTKDTLPRPNIKRKKWSGQQDYSHTQLLYTIQFDVEFILAVWQIMKLFSAVSTCNIAINH